MKRLVLILAVLYAATAAAQLRTETRLVITVVNSVTLSPSSIIGGATVNGVVTLNQAAGTNGVTVKFASSNVAVAIVPASVVVQPGATSAMFVIQTYPVTANPNVITDPPFSDISAQIGTMTPKTARLTVLPPSFVSLTLDPVSLPGGGSAVGNVTISGPAPTGGFAIALNATTLQSTTDRTVDILRSDDILRSEAPVTVPSQVVVPAASTSASFPIATRTVSATAQVQINATRGPFVTKTANLTVLPPSVSSISFSPCPASGISVSGRVTLTSPAPGSGMTIPLSIGQIVFGGANDCSLSSVDACGPHPVVPPNVQVAGGDTSAAFPVTVAPGKGCYRVSAGGTSGVLQVTFPTMTLMDVPASVKGGTSIQVRVVLRGVENDCPWYGHTPGRYPIQSSNPNLAQVPAEVLIPIGGSAGAFTITTAAVPNNQTVTISVAGFVGACGGSNDQEITLTP